MEGQVFTSYPFSGCHWDSDIIFEVRSLAAHVRSLGVPLPLCESEAFGLGKRQQDLACLWPTAPLNEQDQRSTLQ